MLTDSEWLSMTVSMTSDERGFFLKLPPGLRFALAVAIVAVWSSGTVMKAVIFAFTGKESNSLISISAENCQTDKFYPKILETFPSENNIYKFILLLWTILLDF
jgi:hypothetical protein